MLIRRALQHPHCLFQLLRCQPGLFRVAEARQAEVTLTLCAKACARRTHNARMLQQMIEEIPGLHAAGALHPDIRAVFASAVPYAGLVQRGRDDGSIGPVVVDGCSGGFLPLLREHGRSRPLHNVRYAVVFRGLAAQPHGIEVQAAAHQRLRHYGIAAPRPRKARRFGKRTEFDGAGLGAVYLVDAVGHVPVCDEALISRVEQQHRAALIRIIHPRLKLIPAVRRARGVIGAAQVNQVRLYICLRHGQKTVFPRGRRIHDTPPGHHIGIHIDRIDGVGHKDGIVYIEQVQDIPDVAFRTVAHKDLVLRQHNAAPGVITHQSLLQKAVALLRTVPLKGLGFCHLEARSRHLLRDGGPSGQAQLAGDPPLVHRVVFYHVRIFTVGEDGQLLPVGQDQKQHVEIARDIAERFNGIYGNVFTVPEPRIAGTGARIMSLADPTKKMSKSDKNQNAFVLLMDKPEGIMRKFKRAVTDSGSEVRRGEGKHGVNNLIAIYSAAAGCTPEEAEERFAGKGYGDFKKAVGEAVVEVLRPVREKTEDLLNNKDYLEKVYTQGAENASRIARRTLEKVYKKVGFIKKPF